MIGVFNTVIFSHNKLNNKRISTEKIHKLPEIIKVLAPSACVSSTEKQVIIHFSKNLTPNVNKKLTKESKLQLQTEYT